MPIASNFLVPNGTFIVEVVAFLFVLGFIARKVLPPLNKVLEERQEQIRASLEAADAAQTEAAETRAQRQGILDEARQEATDIKAQANRTAERTRAEPRRRVGLNTSGSWRALRQRSASPVSEPSTRSARRSRPSCSACPGRLSVARSTPPATGP